MKAKLHKIASILSYVLLFASLLLLGIVFTARAKGEVPAIGGYSLHVVVTGSMSTTEKDSIDEGDAVIIKHCTLQEVQVNDIILFHTDDPDWRGDGVDLVLHRVMAKNQQGEETISLTTKGDANNSTDEYPAIRIVGKLKYRSTVIGSIVAFFTQGRNILFLLAIIVLIVVIATLVRRLTQTIKDSEENKAQIDDETKERIRRELVEKLFAEIQANNNSKDSNHDDGKNTPSQR